MPRVVDKGNLHPRKCSVPTATGCLSWKEKETFAIELPAVPSKSAGTACVKPDGRRDQRTRRRKGQDRSAGGHLIYTTDVDGQGKHSRIPRPVAQNGRPLIVMQLTSVNLDKEMGGINWNQLQVRRAWRRFETLCLRGSTVFTSIWPRRKSGRGGPWLRTEMVIGTPGNARAVPDDKQPATYVCFRIESLEFRVGGRRDLKLAS